MRLSNFEHVQRLVAEHCALRQAWRELSAANRNSRFVTVTSGYFEDSQKSTAVEPKVICDDRCQNISRKILDGAQEALNQALKEVEVELLELGVDASQ